MSEYPMPLIRGGCTFSALGFVVGVGHGIYMHNYGGAILEGIGGAVIGGFGGMIVATVYKDSIEPLLWRERKNTTSRHDSIDKKL